eukprot:1680648-Prymnesium_polylepis.1
MRDSPTCPCPVAGSNVRLWCVKRIPLLLPPPPTISASATAVDSTAQQCTPPPRRASDQFVIRLQLVALGAPLRT